MKFFDAFTTYFKPGKKKKSRSARPKGSKNPPDIWWRRWLWYLNPRRFVDFWFTKRGLFAALRIGSFFAGIAIIGIAGLFLYFAKDLPSPGQINSRPLEQTTKFYDRTGKTVLYEVFGDQNRTYVDLDKMGPYLAKATIAIEDKRFYEQGAFSVIGILRATIENAIGDTVQGGSTITQQYVKNALLTNERTITRKIKELILSIQIEQLYEKDDILELYLNEISYGAQAYGVQAASQMYFSKDADKLSLAQAAMIAALPQAPTYYSPYGQHVDDLIERQKIVLDLMLEQGHINQEEYDDALEVDVIKTVNATPGAYRNLLAPHFVIRVQERLEAKYGVDAVTKGGLKVITTIDLKKQKIAEKAVKDGIANVEAAGGNNAALVASDPNTGQILALVGSRDFNHKKFGAFNAATAKRQPGSSFKPYVYAQGFETKKWGPGSVMYDVKTDFGNYAPNNFDNSFRGIMTIRSALAESRNIPAVKMLYIVGLQNTLNKVKELGITTLGDASNYGLSLVLGSGEVQLNQHVNGYETFANGGVHYDQVDILKITDPDGTILEEWKPVKGKRVFDPQVAYLIANVLTDDSARAATFGANNPNLNIPGYTVGVKTGSTDDLKDGWMMGFSKNLVAGVWVGHNQNQPMSIATSRSTGPIFTQFMREALKGTKDEPFVRPAGIKSVTLDRFTGDIASKQSKSTVTDLFPSYYEPTSSGAINTATIDTISNKLATDCTPKRAQKEITSYGLKAEIPADDPAFPRWNPPVAALASRLGLGSGGSIPTDKDDVHKCGEEPVVTITAKDNTGTEENTIPITVKLSNVTYKIKSLEVSYNNQVIQRIDDARNCNKNQKCEYTFDYTAKSPGDYKFSVLVIDEVLFEDSDTSGTVKVEDNSPETIPPDCEGLKNKALEDCLAAGGP